MFDKYLIDELCVLERAATPGPWKLSVDTCGDSYIDSLKIQSPWIEDAWGGDDEANANMKLIAAMRNTIPDILDEIRRLTAELERYRKDEADGRIVRLPKAQPRDYEEIAIDIEDYRREAIEEERSVGIFRCTEGYARILEAVRDGARKAAEAALKAQEVSHE